MRIALISDIHGNCVALDAAIADVREQSVDQIVCLGDAIQGGAQPAETVARLRALACPIIMGNADAWLLTGEDTGVEPVTERQLAVRAWSLAQLSGDDCDFIRSFQPTISLALSAERRLLCFHGSPSSFDDIILPETADDEAIRLLRPQPGQTLAGGHTHRQQIRSLGTALFINPGSVGLPDTPPLPGGGALPKAPWAEYAIVEAGDDGRIGVKFRRIPYDAGVLRRSLEASGKPFVQDELAQLGEAG
jgi:predicted phosphodiesterase